MTGGDEGGGSEGETTEGITTLDTLGTIDEMGLKTDGIETIDRIELGTTELVGTLRGVVEDNNSCTEDKCVVDGAKELEGTDELLHKLELDEGV